MSSTVTGRPLSSQSRSASTPMSNESMVPPVPVSYRPERLSERPMVRAANALEWAASTPTRAVPPSPRGDAVRRVLPGLIVTIVCAIASRFFHGLLPAKAGAVLGEVVVAVLLGLVIGNVIALPEAL